MSQDANLESSQVSNHCGACWWRWQIFEQAAELRGKLRPVSVSQYLLVLLFVHLPWQAKQLQFAEWIDSTFPADPETFGCKNRCNMQ